MAVKAPPTRRVALKSTVIGAGALAGALGSIIALAVTVTSWLGGGPAGVVEKLAITSVKPLTYGEWRDHEGVTRDGVPPPQLRVPGRLIAYDIDTRGYDDATRLPVRILVHDVTHRTSRTVEADDVRVQAGDDCGCFDWVAVPPGRSRYYLEVVVYPPGPIRGQPIRHATTTYFRGEIVQ